MANLIENSAENSTCIQRIDVDWISWKAAFADFFKIPKELHKSKYHVFSFAINFKGAVRAKELTSSTSWNEFNMLKRNTTPYNAGISARRRTKIEKYKETWTKLEEVPSTKHSNRKNYLEKLICERFFNNDATFRGRFFSYGKN